MKSFKFKKSIITALAAASLLVCGGQLEMTINHTQTVQAASRAAYLKRNAYIYNNHGYRKSKRLWHIGHRIRVYSRRRIRHRSFYHVGTNKYIRIGNVAFYPRRVRNRIRRNNQPKNYLFEVKCWDKDSLVYNEPINSDKYLADDAVGGKQKVYQVVRDAQHDELFYKIGTNRWILAEETNRHHAPVTNPNPMTQSQTQDNQANDSQGQQSQSNSNDTTGWTKIPSEPTHSASATAPTHSASASPSTNNNNSVSHHISHKSTWSESQIRECENEFLDDVNDWRQSQGLQSFDTSEWLRGKARTRANDSIQEMLTIGDYTHNRPDGSYGPAILEQGTPAGLHLYSYDEVLAMGVAPSINSYSPKQFADMVFDGMVNHDADSNWGHRRTLSESGQTMMGVGVVVQKHNGQFYFSLAGDTADLEDH